MDNKLGLSWAKLSLAYVEISYVIMGFGCDFRPGLDELKDLRLADRKGTFAKWLFEFFEHFDFYDFKVL